MAETPRSRLPPARRPPETLPWCRHMDWFLFWDCLAVIGAIVVHRWAGIAVARYADGDPSRAPSVASLAARSADGLGHAIRRRFGGRAMSLRFAGLSVLGALVLGGVPVVAGSLVFAPAPVETMAFAGRFFAAPVSLAAWLSLMGTVFLLEPKWSGFRLFFCSPDNPLRWNL